jgi:hypothetical protein
LSQQSCFPHYWGFHTIDKPRSSYSRKLWISITLILSAEIEINSVWSKDQIQKKRRRLENERCFLAPNLIVSSLSCTIMIFKSLTGTSNWLWELISLLYWQMVILFGPINPSNSVCARVCGSLKVSVCVGENRLPARLILLRGKPGSLEKSVVRIIPSIVDNFFTFGLFCYFCQSNPKTFWMHNINEYISSRLFELVKSRKSK